jgi:hypothetical protein
VNYTIPGAFFRQKIAKIKVFTLSLWPKILRTGYSFTARQKHFGDE